MARSRRRLDQDVGTVGPGLHHAPDAPDLALDAVEPVDQRLYSSGERSFFRWEQRQQLCSSIVSPPRFVS